MVEYKVKINYHNKFNTHGYGYRTMNFGTDCLYAANQEYAWLDMEHQYLESVIIEKSETIGS